MCRIFFAPGILDKIALHSRRGYCAKYKEERVGMLFGRWVKGAGYRVIAARAYKGGQRKRTWFTFTEEKRAYRRTRTLAETLHLRFLGFYHSHPEVNGQKSWGPSEADLEWFRNDSHSPLLFIVGIGDNNGEESHLAHNGDGTLTFRWRGHYYRFNARCKKHKAQCHLYYG